MRALFVCKLVVVSLFALLLTAAAGQEQEKKNPDKVNVKAQETPKLPDGVILVKLPPGEVRMENIVRDGKPILRVTVGKTVIEAKDLFFGDFKGALHLEATTEGMHWVPAKGGKGFVIDGTDTHEPGSTLGAKEFLTVNKLKAGSVYVTTPSLRFEFGQEAKPKRDGIATQEKEKGPGSQERKPSEKKSGAEIEKLVNQLGSSSAQTRETASKALVKIGEDTLPFLKSAIKSSDSNLELRRRAQILHTQISEVVEQRRNQELIAKKLPDGVIHVALPPGKLRMENIVTNGKPLIRLTIDKTVIEARSIFLGDAKGATHYEAIKEGMHWAPASGGKGFVIDGVEVFGGGSTIGDPDFHSLEKLKAGSLFITTPSVRFLFGPDAKPNPKYMPGVFRLSPPQTK